MKKPVVGCQGSAISYTSNNNNKKRTQIPVETLASLNKPSDMQQKREWFCFRSDLLLLLTNKPSSPISPPLLALSLLKQENREQLSLKTAMGSRGPSPLVPSLMVGALGLIICKPTLVSLLEISVSLFQLGADTEGRATFAFVMLLLLLVLLALQVVSYFFPEFGMSSPVTVHQTSSSDQGGDGFGFGFGVGSFLLLVLFLVLYHLVWARLYQQQLACMACFC